MEKDKIAEIIENITGKSDDLTNYSLVKDRLVARLINSAANKEKLERLVSLNFFDLAIIFSIMVDQDRNTVISIPVTKKMAEDLTDYLTNIGIRCRYMHSDIGTIERMEIIRDFRLNKFDVLIGINLLREGLDIPEVGLVAILDADKEGFLRSETSLIQTVGRAARNAEGEVIMYADSITRSMRICIDETNRRREKQEAYNTANNIVPMTIVKDVHDIIEISSEIAKNEKGVKMTQHERLEAIEKLEKQMKLAASMLEYELDAQLRDEIIRLRGIK